MKKKHADRIAEHTTLRAKERAAMVANGAGENTLYGFDIRSARLLKELCQQLQAEKDKD